jgi:phosphoribosylformimino-5-aminoimidazole carboxamide ribonucleotide (ProFAR) isomerase
MPIVASGGVKDADDIRKLKPIGVAPASSSAEASTKAL